MEATINQNKEFIIGKPMNEWIEIAKGEPVPKMLFSELWHEGEVCILFSSTGLGKSVLAMQIADSISRGISIPYFKMEAEKQKILYFDFELSNKQIQKRYSINFENDYLFDDNFIRVKIDVTKMPDGVIFENYLISEMEKYIVNSNVKIIIIDNLTYLRGDVEHAKDALPFMKTLNSLKEVHNLSILVLAHSPKRSEYNPITTRDLSGSSALSQFCDSCFAIGKSVKEPKTRYIKQLKERYTEELYGGDNVIVCSLEQPNNYLHFKHTGYGSEQDFLQNKTDAEKSNRIELSKSMSKEGKSLRTIGDELGVSQETVRQWLLKDNKLSNNPFQLQYTAN